MNKNTNNKEIHGPEKEISEKKIHGKETPKKKDATGKTSGTTTKKSVSTSKKKGTEVKKSIKKSKVKNTTKISQKASTKPRKSKSGAKKSGRKQKKQKVIYFGFGTAAILIMILAIGVLVFRPHYPSNLTGAKTPEGNWQYMLDISHHNPGKIEWDSLMVMTDWSGNTCQSIGKAREIKPVRIVIMKATEGKSHKDKEFRRRWKEAESAHVTRGAYHFFRSSVPGDIQAKNFIRTVGQLRKEDFPPILDIETIHKGCTHKQLNDNALKWLKAIHKHYGVKPVIYTSDSFARDILDKRITGEYPLWIARYNTTPPRTEGWKYWQFSDKAVVYGVNGLVDLSVFTDN